MNTANLSPFSHCYVAEYKNKPIAFMAIMKIHFGTIYYRVSRLVVLPDYQGVGIGKRFLTFMADFITNKTGILVTIVTTNPQLIRSDLGSNWIIRRVGKVKPVCMQKLNAPYTQIAAKRLTVTLRYIPNKK